MDPAHHTQPDSQSQMSDFRDCIVSFLDLDDTKALIKKNSRSGARAMRDLHQLVSNIASKLTFHEEVCFWQDSVLLLATVDSSSESYSNAIEDVERLKAKIDEQHRCHVVCIKGQSFPAPTFPRGTRKPRTVYLSASSFAFANCFIVESRLGKHRAGWYIDSRIARKIEIRRADSIEKVKLLPTNVERAIHMYRDVLR